MNSSDFTPSLAGEVVPDPFAPGADPWAMEMDPMRAATAYHAARAWGFQLQTEAEPDNPNAVAFLMAEYHIASLYYAQMTGSFATESRLVTFNKGMRENPENTAHNILHMLGVLGVDHREIAPFVSGEPRIRTKLRTLAMDLKNHMEMEGEAVVIKTSKGWYDVLDAVNEILEPARRPAQLKQEDPNQ